MTGRVAGRWISARTRVCYTENDLLELRRQVVLVDQSPLLFTGSVAKNVEFGLRMRKIPAAERKKRVIEALELVGMAGFIEAEAHRLSGGETKRVALARALAVGPQVLLCDEPTANVDSENQRDHPGYPDGHQPHEKDLDHFLHPFSLTGTGAGPPLPAAAQWLDLRDLGRQAVEG